MALCTGIASLLTHVHPAELNSTTRPSRSPLKSLTFDKQTRMPQAALTLVAQALREPACGLQRLTLGNIDDATAVELLTAALHPDCPLQELNAEWPGVPSAALAALRQQAQQPPRKLVANRRFLVS